ncbi:MAG: hypothetical protein GX121_04265 [Ignavibacteria bacterium]|nr:hypothetical protein [Ignavibacteria bacterium]
MKKIIVFLFALLSNLAFAQQEYLLHPLNLDFEDGELGKIALGWELPGFALKQGYDAYLVDSAAYQGKYSLMLYNDNPIEEKKFGIVQQMIDAKNYRGKKVYFKAAVKVEPASLLGTANLFMRVYLPGNVDAFYEAMKDSPIVRSDWNEYEIEGEVHPEAEIIRFGAMLRGGGILWIDAADFGIIGEESELLDPAQPLRENGLQNLSSFAKIYGNIRYFYPDLNLQNFDWEHFVLSSISKVENLKNQTDFIDFIKNSFSPLAPYIHFEDSQKKAKDYKFFTAEDKSKNIHLAVKHIGPATGTKSEVFESQIVNVNQSQREMEGIVFQYIDAEQFKGKTIKFKAFSRIEAGDSYSQGQMWLQINLDKNNVHSITALEDPILKKEWTEYEVAAEIPENADKILLALVLIGEGKIWFDETNLEIIDKKNKVSYGELRNYSFEEGDFGKIVRGWTLYPNSEIVGYKGTVTNQFYKGKKSLLIEADEKTKITFPSTEENFVEKIAENLYFLSPAVIKTDSAQVLSYFEGKDSLAQIFPDSLEFNAKSRKSRLAIVIIAWNIFKHFNLYNDNSYSDNTENWDIVLKDALEKAARDKNELEFLETIKLMVSELKDGQTRAWYSKQSIRYALPFLWEWLDGKLYISKVSPNEQEIKPGDEVLEINGKKTALVLKESGKSVSSSTEQWRIIRTLAEIRAGDENSEINLKLKTLAGKEIEVQKKRNIQLNELFEERPDEFYKFKPNYYYIDLTRVNDKEFKEITTKIAFAEGIIFDLRGLCLVSEHFLSFFIENPIKSFEWRVPVFTTPNKELVSYQVSSASITPRSPHIKAKLVFLVDKRTIGYAEAVLSLIKKHKLATILGSNSAGSAGEIQALKLPAFYFVSLSSIYAALNDKLLYGDIVQPDILIEPNLESIIYGEDAILKKAMELFEEEN